MAADHNPAVGALIEFALAVWRKLEPSLPGVMGAAVAQMMRPGLGVRQRLIQWTVGVIVFHFVIEALTVVFRWPEAVADVVGFFIAFLAFEALHAWQKAAIEAGVSAIRDTGVVWRHLLQGWAAKAGASQQPPKTEGEG
ncbi:MAG: hypothetical protein ACREEY_04700 [Brevundimonas sp.]